MTLHSIMDRLVKWIDDNVCREITFKLPNDATNDAEYSVKYVRPKAFPLYVPGKEKLPPSVAAPIPSVCVQFMEGNDDLSKHQRRLKIRLCLACWNPGEHSGEIFHPRKNTTALGGYSYYLADQEGGQTYTRNMEGWRDIINFTDLTLRTIENAEYIEGMRIVKESGIKYGIFTEDGKVWDYYPYWHDWISLELDAGVGTRTPDIYKDLL